MRLLVGVQLELAKPDSTPASLAEVPHRTERCDGSSGLRYPRCRESSDASAPSNQECAVQGEKLWSRCASPSGSCLTSTDCPPTRAVSSALIACDLVLEHRLRQHYMHSLVAIHQFGDVHVAGHADQHIGIFAAHLLLRGQEIDHLPHRDAGRFV
jgi:hypothetical protein